jgi:chromosomal replication initiator protein
VDLHPTDYELRLGILQTKAEFYRSNTRAEDRAGVLEFLAHRITTNVRVLEGALTRLFRLCQPVGREITLELTQDCLADILRASDRKVTIEEIQRKVAEHYNIRLSDMIGPKRAAHHRPPASGGDVSVQAADHPSACPRSGGASAGATTPRSCTACARSRN